MRKLKYQARARPETVREEIRPKAGSMGKTHLGGHNNVRKVDPMLKLEEGRVPDRNAKG